MIGPFFGRIGYYITHPEAMAYAVANVLFYPALWTLLASLVFALVAAGQLTAELIARRRGGRSATAIETAARAAREDLAAGRADKAIEKLRTIRHTKLVAAFMDALPGPEALWRLKLAKSLDDVEILAEKRLEPMRVLVRVAPILGLMTTLIPISPALVALARGDVVTLSNKLVVAFSSTVLGLLVGGLAYLILTVRRRWYSQDLSDIAYVVDIMGA